MSYIETISYGFKKEATNFEEVSPQTYYDYNFTLRNIPTSYMDTKPLLKLFEKFLPKTYWITGSLGASERKSGYTLSLDDVDLKRVTEVLFETTINDKWKFITIASMLGFKITPTIDFIKEWINTYNEEEYDLEDNKFLEFLLPFTKSFGKLVSFNNTEEGNESFDHVYLSTRLLFDKDKTFTEIINTNAFNNYFKLDLSMNELKLLALLIDNIWKYGQESLPVIEKLTGNDLYEIIEKYKIINVSPGLTNSFLNNVLNNKTLSDSEINEIVKKIKQEIEKGKDSDYAEEYKKLRLYGKVQLRGLTFFDKDTLEQALNIAKDMEDKDFIYYLLTEDTLSYIASVYGLETTVRVYEVFRKIIKKPVGSNDWNLSSLSLVDMGKWFDEIMREDYDSMDFETRFLLFPDSSYTLEQKLFNVEIQGFA